MGKFFIVSAALLAIAIVIILSLTEPQKTTPPAPLERPAIEESAQLDKNGKPIFYELKKAEIIEDSKLKESFTDHELECAIHGVNCKSETPNHIKLEAVDTIVHDAPLSSQPLVNDNEDELEQLINSTKPKKSDQISSLIDDLAKLEGEINQK